MRRVHPIETESYRILREIVDLSYLGPLSRAVAERVIHASADPEYAETLALDEGTLQRAVEALRRGASRHRPNARRTRRSGAATAR